MTEQGTYEMLLTDLIRAGINAHTLAEAEPRIMSVCVKCSLTTPVETVMSV